MNNAKKLKIHFNYKNKITSIDCNYNEKLSDILSKLNDININSVHCIYSNKIIENKEFTISQIINNNDSIINEIEIQIIDIENNQIYNKIMDSSLNSSQDQKNIIDSFDNDIKNIIFKLNELTKNINILYNESKNKIYYNKLNEVDKNAIFNDIKETTEAKNINNKFKK